MGFDGATVLLQWATGCLLFLWVTGRRREVGIGYGWTVRGTAIALAAGALAAGIRYDLTPVREAATAGVLVVSVAAMVDSWRRRKAGVALQRERAQVRSKEISEMTGIDRSEQEFSKGPEFNPAWDLVAAAVGGVGLVAASIHAGGPLWLTFARIFVGTAFLGVVSDAMLLGHWYLVQPGLPRAPLLELVKWLQVLTPIEIVLMLLPTGMFSVFSGAIDDHYGGMLGWFWIACAVTTMGLAWVTRQALKERQYAAVMAATGLLYLAILTAFGVDLVARALLAP